MIDLKAYGYQSAENIKQAGIPARVTAVHRDRFEIISCHGCTGARMKGSAGFRQDVHPTVGDFVLVHYNPSGDSMIVRTLERRSKFSRNDFSGHAAGYVKTVLEQVVAANFDYVFIMASLNHDFNLQRIERYLALTEQSGGIPVVVLTKADLVTDFSQQLSEVQQIAPGVDVFAVSVVTGVGTEHLQKYQNPGKTIVFLGSSGAGKSSLVNWLAGEPLMETGEIRQDDSKGRHTTTTRQLLMLKSGLMVIDTPGMRELGMWGGPEGLESTFHDVEAFFELCRFRNCRHHNEPGCAVQAAIASGELSRRRWQSYQNLHREVRFADQKSKPVREVRRRTIHNAGWEESDD